MKIKYLIFTTLLTGSVFSLEETITVNVPLTIEQINEQISGAKYWGITRSEYALALKLKKQYGNLITGQITPLEYLGIFAKAKQDKEKYAELYIQLNRAVTQQILDFDRVVQRANIELFGHDDLIKYQIKNNNTELRKRTTIDISNCNEACRQNVRRLDLESSFKRPVDFYFTNATNAQIRAFASKLKISASKVNSGTVTLNHAQ